MQLYAVSDTHPMVPACAALCGPQLVRITTNGLLVLSSLYWLLENVHLVGHARCLPSSGILLFLSSQSGSTLVVVRLSFLTQVAAVKLHTDYDYYSVSPVTTSSSSTCTRLFGLLGRGQTHSYTSPRFHMRVIQYSTTGWRRTDHDSSFDYCVDFAVAIDATFFHAAADILDAHLSTKICADVFALVSLVLSRRCLGLVNDERQRATPTAVDAVYLDTRKSDVTSLGLRIRIAVVDGCAEVDQASTAQKAFLDVITGAGKPLTCKLWDDRDDGFGWRAVLMTLRVYMVVGTMGTALSSSAPFDVCLWHFLLRSVPSLFESHIAFATVAEVTRRCSCLGHAGTGIFLSSCWSAMTHSSFHSRALLMCPAT